MLDVAIANFTSSEYHVASTMISKWNSPQLEVSPESASDPFYVIIPQPTSQWSHTANTRADASAMDTDAESRAAGTPLAAHLTNSSVQFHLQGGKPGGVGQPVLSGALNFTAPMGGVPSLAGYKGCDVYVQDPSLCSTAHLTSVHMEAKGVLNIGNESVRVVGAFMQQHMWLPPLGTSTSDAPFRFPWPRKLPAPLKSYVSLESEEGSLPGVVSPRPEEIEGSVNGLSPFWFWVRGTSEVATRALDP